MNRILLHKKDKVRIQNNFEIIKPQKIESKNKNYFIDDEGYLHWSPKGGNEVKRAKEIWQKVKHADQTRQLATALEKGSLTRQQTKAIVLHRTDTDTSLQAINGFLRGVGTHFLIDKDGTIYQCASLYKWTQHVGDIRSKTELEKTYIYAHAKIAYKDKNSTEGVSLLEYIKERL